MRFLLIVLGFLLLAVGVYAVAYGPVNAHRDGSLMVQVGAIFFAAGAIGIDIVAVIKRRGG